MEGGRLKENSAKLREQILPNLDAFYLKLREGLTVDNEKTISKHQDSTSKIKIELAKIQEEIENENLVVETLNDQINYYEQINVQLSKSISGLYGTKNAPKPNPPEPQISTEAHPILQKQKEIIAELTEHAAFYEKQLGMNIENQDGRITIEYDYIRKERGIHKASLFIDPKTSELCIASIKPNLPKIQELLVEFELTLNFRKFVSKLRKAFCDLYQ